MGDKFVGIMRRRNLFFVALVALAIVSGLTLVSVWNVRRIAPAPSFLLQASATSIDAAGAALFAFGDFGSIDLDTLESTAMPWPILAAALALAEAGGETNKVAWRGAQIAFKRLGFLYPVAVRDQPSLRPSPQVPLGFSIGRVERQLPPLRVTAVNIGCAACHAGPAYGPDGSPDVTTAVLGRPNSGLNLEAFSQSVYRALKAAFADETNLFRAMARLFPEMTMRERLSLRWVVLPRARARLNAIMAGIDKPLSFHNGAPGLTNGVGSLKARLGVTRSDRYDGSAGFVSVPDLADRSFRSAFLADGAYAPKGSARFRTIERVEAMARDNGPIAAVASFFMVPSMGLTPQRTEAAIPQLKVVLDYLRQSRPPRFPGPIDNDAAKSGRDLYARACASCHGVYDESLAEPRLLSFPNWAGDVGADASRRNVFDAPLKTAIDQTRHGQHFIEAAVTEKMAAPLLSGLWSSAPYLTNGSIPTLRHFLDPQSRPKRFMAGGHRLSLRDVGIDGVLLDDAWVYPEGYTPYSQPVEIDTTKSGFSNQGHEKEVQGLSSQERDALIEYLKLL